MADSQAAVLFLDLAAVLLIAPLAGRAASALGQPAVLGEIVAGVLLGPTLLRGHLSDTLFPSDLRPFLGVLANVGLVLFMFVVGLEFDHGRLRGFGRVTGTIAASAALTPLALGCLLALRLAQSHETANRFGFVLFFGIAMSITAFPVLARILVDRRMNRTLVGSIALTAAAVSDLAAWTVLALVQVLVDGESGRQWTVLLAVPFTAVLVFLVRPFMRRMLIQDGEDAPLAMSRFTALLAFLFASAAVTQLIGLHFVFGAFLFGLVVPRAATERTRHDLMRRARTAGSFLLPVYFLLSGLNVDLSTLGFNGLLELALILVTAITGKFVGTMGAARAQGMTARRSAILASLMNTRGLTELIVLGIGLQTGVFDKSLYSQMVVMAIVTTGMAGVLLRRLAGPEDHNEQEADDAVEAGATGSRR
ncbi:cation:proton antiporter [Streptomyces sp. NPDC048385]|uniref:cation:proton antiporter n=1 Tax=unclassified Streptomyces TaxID=2593676 RepID=UPI003448D53F